MSVVFEMLLGREFHALIVLGLGMNTSKHPSGP